MNLFWEVKRSGKAEPFRDVRRLSREFGSFKMISTRCTLLSHESSHLLSAWRT
jgi:hypothetical protein